MSKRRNREDLFTLLAAVAILLVVVASWFVLSHRHEARRKEVLAGVPEFPEPKQAQRTQGMSDDFGLHRAQAEAQHPVADAGTIQSKDRRVDRMDAFVLGPSHNMMLVRVNSLFNTPLYDRFKECAPEEFKDMQEGMKRLGVDPEKDIDRVAMMEGGVAVSGFFEGKPIAETITRNWNATPTTYRGQTIYVRDGGGCLTQVGNLILTGRPRDDQQADCESLVDRVLDPPEGNPDDVYGDLYARSDLERFQSGGSAVPKDQDMLQQVLDGMNGVTMRANVWNDVAVSVEGAPKDDKKLNDLVHMARGALQLAKTQVGEDDDKLQALADLAKVSAQEGQLKIDLALPADDLFDRLDLPCPGRVQRHSSARQKAAEERKKQAAAGASSSTPQ
ncbi:MAG: hypothetical protein JST92_19990 [Deltaproteobacteria bacterium]|nr:hypothetical protein [Deltaproteobacteria bacterium]